MLTAVHPSAEVPLSESASESNSVSLQKSFNFVIPPVAHTPNEVCQEIPKSLADEIQQQQQTKHVEANVEAKQSVNYMLEIDKRVIRLRF